MKLLYSQLQKDWTDTVFDQKLVQFSAHPVLFIVLCVTHVIGVIKVEVHPFLNNSKLVEFSQQNGIQVTAFSPLGNPARSRHAFLLSSFTRTTLQCLLITVKHQFI